MVGAGKFRPEFQLYKAEDPKTGKKAPPGGLSRLANLLYITALGEAHLDMINSEVAAALARRSTSSTEIAKMLAKIDPEVFEELFNDENPKSVEVAEYVNNPENRPRLVQYIIKNFTPKNREFIKDVDPEDLDDAVGDAVDDIENAADTIGGDFKKEIDEIVSADPTTFIEIKIQDMDRAEDVSKHVSRYANEDGVEITNDGVQFSIDPDMPLAKVAKKLALKGLEQKIESEMQGDISRITDNIVILHLPQEVIDQAEVLKKLKLQHGITDEDYEQDMYGMEGNESYAANENEVQEDNEEERQRRENEREEARDRAREAEDKGDWEKWNEEENKRELARDRLREIEDNELDHFLTKEQPEDNIPTDYESVIADLVSKDKKEHALKQLNGDDDDPGHIDDMRAEYPPDPFGGGDEEFNYSPMLDSYKTSTADYLTEQAASDKRNKKTEVKNQSFKEKYKPNTHWQLQELRKYGL